jgi:hypothetical protein
MYIYPKVEISLLYIDIVKSEYSKDTILDQSTPPNLSDAEERKRRGAKKKMYISTGLWVFGLCWVC